MIVNFFSSNEKIAHYTELLTPNGLQINRFKLQQRTTIHSNFISTAIIKTRIQRMRARIQRIRRIARAIFKRFLSFVYSSAKGFAFFAKLSSELYLPEG